MLNPALPKDIMADDSSYVLPEKVVKRVIDENSQTDTFPELRVSGIYTKEIWLKLKSLGIYPDSFKDKKVLDLCAGTGFLTYHIMSRAHPASVDLIDISSAEITQAKKLLKSWDNIHYIVGDVQVQPFRDKYDIVIGNSFMHHLYDIPAAIDSFKSYLKPGGTFVVLHEPTAVAPFVESANLRAYLKALRNPARQIDAMRPAPRPGQLSIPSGDVWVFCPGDMEKMFSKAGFASVTEARWHLLRPWVVASNSINLTPSHQSLSSKEAGKLRRSINTDNILRRFLPAPFWGSLAIRATK